MPKRRAEPSEGLLTKTRPRVRQPPMYRVLLHNDDYTPMDFVVLILTDIFHHDSASAHKITLQVHHQGLGVAGIYCFEVAESKVVRVHDLARAEGFPLKCSMEPEGVGPTGDAG